MRHPEMKHSGTKHVVVTGVSSGIGRATAELLLKEGYTVFGSVRREEDARRIGAELGERFTALLFDVTDRRAIEAAAAQVEKAVAPHTVTALVNNAGFACVGPLAHLPPDELRRQLEVNVVGLLQVTQAFLPLLGMKGNAQDPKGRVVNVGSVSGRIAYPFMGAYAASKHAVEALSDALRRELLMYGIDVIVVEPGTVRTPIVDKTTRQLEAYLNTDYGTALYKLHDEEVRERLLSSMPVELVARLVLKAIEHPTPRARYPLPRGWLTGWILPRFLPPRLFDRLVARRIGIYSRP
jgi:NAD(P)-dependent dehydrogenase (short-subunit alcohol dehydrogenase family)